MSLISLTVTTYTLCPLSTTGKKYIFQYRKSLENLSFEYPILDNHWEIYSLPIKVQLYSNIGKIAFSSCSGSWSIIGVLLAHNTLGIPMLDDDVKSLETTSLVTNNGTMIYQAFKNWLVIIGISLWYS